MQNMRPKSETLLKFDLPLNRSISLLFWVQKPVGLDRLVAFQAQVHQSAACLGGEW